MNDHDDDPLFAELRVSPTAAPSRALSACVLARAHAALAEERTTPARGSTSWVLGSAVVAAVAVYLTWAVDFLARLADT